jgi:hypothetical protein
MLAIFGLTTANPSVREVLIQILHNLCAEMFGAPHCAGGSPAIVFHDCSDVSHFYPLLLNH